jgi:hypothetical protein
MKWVWYGNYPANHDDEVDYDGDCYCGNASRCRGSVNPTCQIVVPGDCDDKADDRCVVRTTGEDPRFCMPVCITGAGIDEGCTTPMYAHLGQPYWIQEGDGHGINPGNTREDGEDWNCDGFVHRSH